MEAVEKIKACLFNFIIYTHEDRRVPYFQDLIKSVLDKFPCRIVFICGSPSSQEGIKVKHSTVTTGAGSLEISCDRIDIEASDKDLHKVPFAVLPLIVPDLPLYLLWGEDPTKERDILPHLQSYATRLIFDSECTKELGKFSHHILSSMKSIQCDVIDMNWARFANWRGVLARVFYSKDTLDHLKLAKEVVIHYNGRTSSSFQRCAAQADYLQAWLASRLSWQFKECQTEGEIATFNYAFQGKDIKVSLVPKDYVVFSPGRVASIAIESYDQHYYHLDCLEKSPSQVVVKKSTDLTCDIDYTLPLPSQSQGAYFIKELLYSPPSAHYIDMLKLLTQELK